MDSYFTDEETLTLLKLVHTKDMQDKFNSNKKKHRKVWEEISKLLESEGVKKSAVKCQNRYENTKRSYNTFKRNQIGSEKPNFAYWDFWESILGEKRDVPFDGFDEFHETYIRLKETMSDSDPIPDWELWPKYEEYYKRKQQTPEADDRLKCSPAVTFSDRETDELLLIMGEPATRQIFIKNRKKHRVAWNYILKCLKRKGIHKTVDKVKNRFENLKRKYMHHKKNLKHTNNVPDWRYWHVFEEYMVNRPNSSDSDFMAEVDEDGEDMEMDRNETSFEDNTSRMEDDFSLIEHPVNVNNRVDRKFCRICLQRERPAFPENIISIFGPLNATIRINEALGVCFGLEIFDEQNSSEENQICLDCLKRLDAAYHFRKLCWESQCRLKYNRMFPHLEDGRNETAIDSCQQIPEESTKNYNQSQDESSLSGFAATFAFDEEFVDTKPKDGTASKIDEKCAVMQPDKFDDKIPEESIGQVDKLTNFQCSICMKKFPNIEYIKKHLVTIHSLISDSQNFRNYLELSNCDSDDELNDNVKCYICGKIYVRREYLKKHLKLIHNVTDADYNVYERIDEANKTTKPLLCHSCGESFVLKHVFKKHIEHHERGSLLSCDYCDIKLVDKSSVERHMVLHTGQRNYKCIFCAKGFFTRISQKRHERNVHTKEKSHICQYCNKKFVMWKFLERHLNTHTAEVVYQCDQCDKKYLNKNHLRVHKFRHAKEPPFKCSVCSKAYFDRSTLKKHNYVHIGNPHQCSHCERSFDRRDKMNAHIRKTHGLSKLNDNDGNTQKM